MKKLASILMILLLVLSPAQAADIIVGTFTFSGNPSDGDTITINGSTRTFKTTVTTPSTEIEIGADAEESIDNAVSQIGLTPFSGVFVSAETATTLELRPSIPGTAFTGSESSSVITFATTTNTFTTMRAVRVPQSGEDNVVRTNVMTLLVTGLQDYAQSAMSQTATMLSEYVSLEQSQSVSNKTFYSTILSSPTTTNLVNRGNAISSPGSGSNSEQFGTGATATGDNSVAVGRVADAGGDTSIAIGDNAEAATENGIAIGSDSFVGSGAVSGIAIGVTAIVSGSVTNAIAIGTLADASYDNSVAIGNGVQTTADDQFRIGSSSHNVVIPGTLTVSTGITNTVVNATTLFVGASSGNNEHTGEWAWTMDSKSSLANGNNAGVDFSGDVFWSIETGSLTGAFTINGIAAGADGDMLIIHNNTGQNMTIAHDSGVDATAANRIYTMTGADVSSTTRCAAWLIYEDTLNRWLLINFQD